MKNYKIVVTDDAKEDLKRYREYLFNEKTQSPISQKLGIRF